MSTIRRGVDLLPLPTQYTTAELVERYRKHLETKINVQACEGIDIPLENIHKALRTRPFEHQGAITQWALRGGKRLIAAQFGLGKTTMASECMRQIHLAAEVARLQGESARQAQTILYLTAQCQECVEQLQQENTKE